MDHQNQFLKPIRTDYPFVQLYSFIHPEFLRMTKNDNQKQTGENEQGENDNQSLKNENDSRKNDNQK